MGESALPEDGGAGAARRAVGAVSSRAPASTSAPSRRRPRVPGVGRCRSRPASVDRLDQVPARLAFLFDYDAGRDAGGRAGARGDDGGRRARGRARRSPRSWRRRRGSIASASARSRTEVKARTGQKGKALFHPIRVALTGRAEGPELDLAVPAIDRGRRAAGTLSGVPTIVGCRERAAAFVARSKRSTLEVTTPERS